MPTSYKKINRRRFIKNTTAFTAASLLSQQALSLTANPPSGKFGSDSTAEQVTVGLDLTGKTAVVTGANSGLGLETMRVLALRGAHVIGAARNMEKAITACNSVQGKATPVVLELGDFDSIAACTDTINALNIPIDILVCNAGIMELPELQLVNGVEKQFAINHLGHYLLTRRLLDQIKAAEQGRVVMVSSLGYKWAPEGGIQFDNLDGSKSYDPKTAYGQSKLANALFALELANRFEGTNATANAIHPGIINTNLGRNFPEWKKVLGELIGWAFMKTVEEGAATSCYVATNPALAQVSGHYFEDCNPVVPEGSYMRDQKLAKQLWDVSEQLAKGYIS
jgi:NAD(P)-dependent dehydrogenase (short-subunit alcohol dehydrogenase family)